MFIQIYISNIFLLDDLFNPFHINCNHCANTSYIHHSLNESLVPTVCVARLIDQPNRINLICGWCRWNPSLRVMRIVNIYTCYITKLDAWRKRIEFFAELRLATNSLSFFIYSRNYLRKTRYADRSFQN